MLARPQCRPLNLEQSGISVHAPENIGTPVQQLDHDGFGHLLHTASKYSALFGGMVFVALVIMSVVSIVGRKLISAPVPGDVELLQTGAAFASASFFAWCHLNKGDVKVDFFTNHLRRETVAKLDAVGSVLVGLFGTLLAWRTAVGAMALREYGETTAILALPVWAAQALMVPGFALLALSGFYMAWRSLRD